MLWLYAVRTEGLGSVSRCGPAVAERAVPRAPEKRGCARLLSARSALADPHPNHHHATTPPTLRTAAAPTARRPQAARPPRPA
ncbi:hypothetical protein GCM10017557_37290 [Streptomyces aurantiacus]|uniref:Uncharacterized protein n=1 Tax=Streptomyces aurantiacus TaxID=47760 RepID=A0A7G1P4Y0_9ACTN|nr:hypothetical protein GCM10017557_37290 [Streptomyces aurantiacus]